MIGTVMQYAQSPLPRFENYPVHESWTGPGATLKLETRSRRLFITRLTEAAKQPADFAGHYKFAMWGCGSSCTAGAIVDLEKGSVFAPPLGGRGSGSEPWIVAEAPITMSDKPYVGIALTVA